jgi:hypothetical protein
LAPIGEGAAGAPEAPSSGNSFTDMGFSESGFFPPDVTMAAGPNNILSASNGRVKIFTKSGTLQSTATLNSFLGTSGSFDPWVVYDPYINRFWLAAANQANPSTTTFFVAVSSTSDANSGFSVFAFDAKVFGSGVINDWCDYPKLGIDSQAIYMTCNMFTLPNDNTSHYDTNKIRVMTKGQFTGGACCSWWDFWNQPDFSGSRAFTIQPAVMIGASNANGEFLITSVGQGGSGNVQSVYQVTNAQNCCFPTQTGPGFARADKGVGGYNAPPVGAQPSGVAGLDTGDTRALFAFWQNGKLATGKNCGAPGCNNGAGGSVPIFDEFDVSAFPAITTVNNWFLPSSGHAYYPMVASNSAGNRTMVYSRSSTSEFVSTDFVGVPPSTACTGCFDGPETSLHAGQNTYLRNCFTPVNLGCTDASNRWGDYSGASPDPDGTGVWIRGEFASSTANIWSTQIGLTFEAGPPSNDDFGNRITLSSVPPVSIVRSTTGATTQLSEPLPCGAIGATIWYSFTPTRPMFVQVDTFGSNYDTALGVYTGSSIGGLSQVGCNDDSGIAGNFLQSRVFFLAAAGVTYQIQVGGFLGATGTSVLNIHAEPFPHDFNVDGRSDILWRNTNTGGVVEWLINGTSVLSSGSPGSAAAPWTIAGSGDFNGDGRADILWWNSATGDAVIWLINGTSVIGTGSPGAAVTPWKIAGIGDFNGDGKSDILWWNTTTGDAFIWLMNGTAVIGTGSPGAAVAPWTIAGVGDFQGDGKADILWWNTSTGSVFEWLLNGTSLIGTGSPGGAVAPWTIAGVGDFNGDGYADILWRNLSSGTVFEWLLNGASIISSGSPGGTTSDWVIANVGDYNGDGNSDILWRNTTTGVVYEWLLNALSVIGQGSPGGATLDWQIQK